jgi:hypothetical protein
MNYFISNCVTPYTLRNTYLASVRSLIWKNNLIWIVRWTDLILRESLWRQCIIIILTVPFISEWSYEMLATVNHGNLSDCSASAIWIWLAWWGFISLYLGIFLNFIICCHGVRYGSSLVVYSIEMFSKIA